MLYILIFIAGIALGFWIKGKIQSSFAKVMARQGKTFTPKGAEEMDELREESKEALTERTEQRKEKILEYMKDREVVEKQLDACNPGSAEVGVIRADIEKLLNVAETTARKYLNELESENKIKQIGEKGPSVHYVLND